jgi:hypothetical protein
MHQDNHTEQSSLSSSGHTGRNNDALQKKPIASVTPHITLCFVTPHYYPRASVTPHHYPNKLRS